MPRRAEKIKCVLHHCISPLRFFFYYCILSHQWSFPQSILYLSCLRHHHLSSPRGRECSNDKHTHHFANLSGRKGREASEGIFVLGFLKSLSQTTPWNFSPPHTHSHHFFILFVIIQTYPAPHKNWEKYIFLLQKSDKKVTRIE